MPSCADDTYTPLVVRGFLFQLSTPTNQNQRQRPQSPTCRSHASPCLAALCLLLLSAFNCSRLFGLHPAPHPLHPSWSVASSARLNNARPMLLPSDIPPVARKGQKTVNNARNGARDTEPGKGPLSITHAIVAGITVSVSSVGSTTYSQARRTVNRSGTATHPPAPCSSRPCSDPAT